MISSLNVVNYRGFKDYKVENIAPVNLFVGRNNVGKTSLIEAVQLLSSTVPLSVLANIARRRNEGARVIQVDEQQRRVWVELVDISHAFHGHKVLSSEIRLSGKGVLELRLTSTPMPKDATKQPKIESATVAPLTTSLLLYAVRDNKVDSTAEITNGGYLEDARRGLRRNVPWEDRTIFISPESLANDLLPVLYNAVVQRAAEGTVVQALQILDESITGIWFLAGTSGADITPGGILLGRNGTERHPLGSYGDGMRRLLSIAMAFVNTANGVLLADEIDTGLHYSVMTDLWRLVTRTSSDLTTQVFATTHSLDCVRGLHLALREDPSRASKVAVHKVDSRLTVAVSLTGTRLIEALDADLELR